MGYPYDGSLLTLGRGELSFNLNDPTTGLPTGERPMGQCTKLEVTPEVEDVREYSAATAASELIARAVIRQTHNLSIVMKEDSKENAALTLLGDNGTLVQGTVASGTEVFASIKLGYWIKTAHRNITVVSLTKTSPTTPLVLGTDYLLDGPGGRIYIIPTTTVVADGDSITLTRTATAKTYQTVRVGGISKIEGALRFVGKPATGPVIEYEFWKVSILPDGAIAVLTGDAFAEMPIKGEVLADVTNHPNEPLYRKIYR